ncbi:unnamed protein product [Rhizoctonia solani]|uniref:Laminin domain protein n=1 Tax=Rhizoctonia solani TaxID=456999 RepID=A0A8H3DB02_9AGAM|nr:unnamed protein product [Rhizoctonia solani]
MTSPSRSFGRIVGNSCVTVTLPRVATFEAASHFPDTTTNTLISTMTLMKLSRSGETILLPPPIPAYLSDMYNLKPIVDKPTDEDVKTIHAIIRSQNTMAHLPTFCNPDLSMQLSQHLFGAQLAVYRASYSMTLLPEEKSVYIPPTLPAHIPGTLKEVVGAPSDEEIKSVQGVVRSLGNLANSPQLFDTNLNMKLSQHMFNLQFARYMQDSADGHFVSETGPDETQPAILQPTQENGDTLPNEAHDMRNEAQNIPLIPKANRAPEALSQLARLGETITDAIKDAMKETNDILKSIDQAPLGLGEVIAKDQFTVGGVDAYYHVYKDPLNQQGISASEYGLPQLRFGYYKDSASYSFWATPDQIARYIKFFGVGADLIQGGEEPQLITGKQGEAERLLLAQIGFV